MTPTEGQNAPRTEYVVRHIHDGRIWYLTPSGERCAHTAEARKFAKESDAAEAAANQDVSVTGFSWHTITVALADVDDEMNDAAWVERAAAEAAEGAA